MNAIPVRPVVVGIDGSAESLHAAAVAARQAMLRGTPLRIVHALAPPARSHLARQGDPRARARVENVLEQAAAAAREAAPGLAVSTDTVAGTDAAVLLDEAERADLLVIGHRGLGTLTGLLTGAVGIQLAGRTACPLMVVRSSGRAEGPVVVGIESPADSYDLLDVAFGEAYRCARPLLVVHAWHIPAPAMVGEAVYGYDLLAEAKTQLVRGAVDVVRERFPQVRVTTSVQYGRPQEILLDAAAEASTLIVGSRGAHGLRGMVLGSMAMAATQAAPCPVMVVPVHRRAHADAESDGGARSGG